MSRFGLGFAAAPAGNDPFTTILLHLDSDIVDYNARGLAHTWTNHGTGFTTGKFGNALSCSASWIDTPDSADYTLGSGDWTIDFWFNVQGGNATGRGLCGQMNAASTVWAAIAFMTVANVIRLSVNSGAAVIDGTTAITAAGWHHYAAVRTGNTLKLFLDGVQEGGNLAFASAVTDSADTFSVGRAGALAANYIGFIDEFRLSVGIARWTSNFSPPTGPYS